MQDEVNYTIFDESSLLEVKEFTDLWIGVDYYTESDLYEILKKSSLFNEHASFIARYKGRLVGIRLTSAPRTWSDDKTLKTTPHLWKVSLEKMAYFKSLFIHKNFQNRGIGKKLSGMSMESLKRMGARGILCHSWLEAPDNSSQKYLSSMGFEKIALHENFWSHIDYKCIRCTPRRCVCTAVEMVKYLE